MKNIIFNNFFLKILSLCLAIFSWFYINNEINQSKKKEKITLVWNRELDLEIKELPVRPNIKGSPPSGYTFVESKLTVNPPFCKVVGKKIILDSIEYVETEPIDLKKFTKTTTVKTSLRPIPNLVITEGEVELTIPIEKARR